MVEGCSKCTLSWEKGDPATWKSEHAKCRCTEVGPVKLKTDEKPSAPFKAEALGWGEDCPTLTDGECAATPNCKKCTLSWPKDDPLSWKSENAKCRCNTNDAPSVFTDAKSPPAPKGPMNPGDLSWGEPCAKLTDGDCPLVKGCATCSWSWPKNDPKTWNSDAAKCRCNTGGV